MPKKHYLIRKVNQVEEKNWDEKVKILKLFKKQKTIRLVSWPCCWGEDSLICNSLNVGLAIISGLNTVILMHRSTPDTNKTICVIPLDCGNFCTYMHWGFNFGACGLFRGHEGVPENLRKTINILYNLFLELSVCELNTFYTKVT